MQEQDDAHKVDRRRLLRQAGAVAAGAAGATVAAAAVAGPAQADPGGNLIIGTSNDGGATTTTLVSGDVSHPALRLQTPGGAALSVAPTKSTDVNTNPPAGSVFVDQWGDVATIGDLGDGSGKYVNYLYSPTWATMTVPVYPDRYLHTGSASGRSFIVPGTATIDSSGRLVPRNVADGADLVLDLTAYLRPEVGYAALQCNLTAVSAAAAGWATMWSGEDDVPPLGGINYQAGSAITNYVQTIIHPENTTVSIKVNQRVVLVVDIMGFVLTDPVWQAAESTGARASSNGKVRGLPLQKRNPGKR
ncbi:hypothetical protein AB0J86_20440 [Micromonospora sp. NPDC049559]|uniref:hypothetical protein n=1 Tax=Micromonospora sp. NPDC049559 TaxID=3155923 RepID=UPI0034236CFA